MKPSVLYINFEDNVSDEDIEDIVSKFYIDNEKAINSMQAQHLKSYIDLGKVSKFSKDFINSGEARK